VGSGRRHLHSARIPRASTSTPTRTSPCASFRRSTASTRPAG
jgi:hypothetical protein